MQQNSSYKQFITYMFAWMTLSKAKQVFKTQDIIIVNA